jgi:hypothetical protein
MNQDALPIAMCVGPFALSMPSTITELFRNYVAQGQKGTTKKDTTFIGAGPVGRGAPFRKERKLNNVLQMGITSVRTTTEFQVVNFEDMNLDLKQ